MIHYENVFLGLKRGTESSIFLIFRSLYCHVAYWWFFINILTTVVMQSRLFPLRFDEAAPASHISYTLSDPKSGLIGDHKDLNGEDEDEDEDDIVRRVVAD